MGLYYARWFLDPGVNAWATENLTMKSGHYHFLPLRRSSQQKVALNTETVREVGMSVTMNNKFRRGDDYGMGRRRFGRTNGRGS